MSEDENAENGRHSSEVHEADEADRALAGCLTIVRMSIGHHYQRKSVQN
jgi:hypothetical protein